MSSSTRASRTDSTPPARARRKTRAGASQPTIAAAGTAASAAVSGTIPEELRRAWVAEAAYYIAERRGFCGGSPDDDWWQAEAQIAQLIAAPRH